MDDGSGYCNKQYRSGLINSSSYIICGLKDRKGTKGQADLSRSHPLGGNIQPRDVALMNLQVSPMSPVFKKTVASAEHQATDPRAANPIRNNIEPYCQVKLESLYKLKDSTRKLLYLLDNLQSKTYSKDPNTNEIKVVPSTAEFTGSETFPEFPSITDVADPALKYLETQTKALNNIYIEDEDDDCSIFKRLTRKCFCLNQQEYNDFIIQFNEDTKYSTSNAGEIIKNLRILKKFLYMGGTYTKNALIFLNEGLEKSAYAEKVEITQGCSHSDMCNVFENHSIVIMCISWPCRYTIYGDNLTQSLTASFLHKLAQLEEGRRYLKYTSKLTNDIRKVLRKRGSQLDEYTKESLKAALNLIHPPMTQNVNYTYYSRQNDEGNLSEIINALQQFRKNMTLAEVFTYLDLLNNFSNAGKDKTDLTLHLPSLLLLFKQMLKDYDNSEMNILITNILNNVVSKNMLKQKEEEKDGPKQLLVAHTATEPIEMRNQTIQMPQEQNPKKKANKSKLYLGYTKFRQPSKLKVSEFANTSPLAKPSSKSYSDGTSVIVVPVEKKRR